MTYLVLTHHHLDHCFAASFFDDRHALIYGHKSFGACMAEMRKHLGANDYREACEAFLKIDSDTCRKLVGSVHPISPHRHVGEETSIAINGEELTIMHVPGHTESRARSSTTPRAGSSSPVTRSTSAPARSRCSVMLRTGRSG